MSNHAAAMMLKRIITRLKSSFIKKWINGNPAAINIPFEGYLKDEESTRSLGQNFLKELAHITAYWSIIISVFFAPAVLSWLLQQSLRLHH